MAGVQVLTTHWRNRQIYEHVNSLLESGIVVGQGKSWHVREAGHYAVHIVDTFTAGPVSDRALFYMLAETFGFPEYYGFSLSAIYDCMTQPGTLNAKYTILMLALRPDLVHYTEPLCAMMSRVSQFYAMRGLSFSTFIIQGPLAASRSSL